MKIKTFAFTSILSLFLFLIISCGQDDRKTSGEQDTLEYSIPSVDTSGAVTGDWIIQRELADPQSLNPITLQDATGREFSFHVFERLMWPADRTSLEPIPWLIEGPPEESPDHLTYTFKLKKNITFSNGSPLTGEDVIFTFKAALNPLVDAAQLRNAIEMVNNVELVNGDKYIIKFSLSRRYFRALISIADVQIMSKEVADPEKLTDQYTFADCKNMETARNNSVMTNFADRFNSQEMARDPKYLIGSGPYIFQQWKTGQEVHFKRNDNYWNKNGEFGKVFPEKLIVRTIQDQSAAVVSAKNREIDLMYVVKPADFVNELADPERFDMKKADPYEPVITYIGWNNLNPMFEDKTTRWALAHLVDRKAIIERIHFGLAKTIESPVYFQDPKHFNPDLPEVPFDIEKAKQLLAQAGWKDNNSDGILEKEINGKTIEFKFTFLNNTNVARRQALLVVTDALKKVGIISDVQDIEWAVFLEKLKKHEFDAFMGAWVLTDYPPDEYQLFHSSQSRNDGSNYTSFRNEEADRLMEAYRDEFDADKRSDIIKKIQKILYDEQAYTFLWTPKAKYVYGTRFKNVRWYPTPITAYQTTEWWVPPGSRKYQSAN